MDAVYFYLPPSEPDRELGPGCQKMTEIWLILQDLWDINYQVVWIDATGRWWVYGESSLAGQCVLTNEKEISALFGKCKIEFIHFPRN